MKEILDSLDWHSIMEHDILWIIGKDSQRWVEVVKWQHRCMHCYETDDADDFSSDDSSDESSDDSSEDTNDSEVSHNANQN